MIKAVLVLDFKKGKWVDEYLEPSSIHLLRANGYIIRLGCVDWTPPTKQEFNTAISYILTTKKTNKRSPLGVNRYRETN